MSRSIGVTLAAALAILSSTISLLMGILYVAFTFLLPAETPEMRLAMFSIILTSTLFVGGGTWGITTAVGLFRLRSWARTSILIFGGILVFMGGMGTLFILFVRLPVPTELPQHFFAATRIPMALFNLFSFVIGLWWLYLFNKTDVRRQFLGDVATIDRSQRPASITVIAWFLLVGAITTPILVLFHLPAALFGLVLTGWSASLLYVGYAAVDLYLGIGLLKLKPLSRALAIYYFLFGFLNSAFFVLLPGREVRFTHSLPPWMRPPSGSAPTLPWGFSLLFSSAGTLLPIWFLVTRRTAYLAAKETPPLAAPVQRVAHLMPRGDNVRRRVIGLGLFFLLVLVAGGYFAYRFVRTHLLPGSLKMPPEMQVARIAFGADAFQKAVFYAEPGLGIITDIRYGGFGNDGGLGLAIVGTRGASLLGADLTPKKRIQFKIEYSANDVTLVDSQGSTGPEFLNRGAWIRRVILFDSQGKVLWTYDSKSGVDDAAAGDLHGDGKLEVAVGLNGGGGIHLLDSTGKELWSGSDHNVWHVEILNARAGGVGEILHSNASGELIERSAAGEVLARHQLSIYLSHFGLTRWGSEEQPGHIVACDGGFIFVIGPDGKQAARLDAPGCAGLGGSHGTPVRFSEHRAYYATLQHYQIWKRSVLYIHDDSGQLAYHEIIADHCGAAAAVPEPGGEVLLVGCQGKVWKYTPSSTSR